MLGGKKNQAEKNEKGEVRTQVFSAVGSGTERLISDNYWEGGQKKEKQGYQESRKEWPSWLRKPSTKQKKNRLFEPFANVRQQDQEKKKKEGGGKW